MWIYERPIAHRGLHNSTNNIPENSILAFDEAVKHGYPIELDVHLIDQEKLIVFHDNNLQRVTGRDLDVLSATWEDIASLRLLDTEHRIPLLQEVFETVNGQVPILIEIKNEGAVGPLETALANAIKSYSGPIAVQSFNPNSIAWFYENDPKTMRGVLSGDFRDVDLVFYKKFVLERMWLNGKAKPHFIAYDHECVPNRWVQREKKRGRKVLCWTIQTAEQAETVKNLCDNIIFEGFRP